MSGLCRENLDCSKDAAGIAGPRNPEGRRKKTERKKPAPKALVVWTQRQRGDTKADMKPDMVMQVLSPFRVSLPSNEQIKVLTSLTAQDAKSQRPGKTAGPGRAV